MKTVAMFKFYAFKKLTTNINDQHLYDYCRDTPIALNLGDDQQINLPSQPILPLQFNDQQQYNMNLSSDIPNPLFNLVP
jgi:hypothetical protein